MRGYKKYFFHKFLWYLLTFVIALIVNFLLPRLIPGNPISLIIAKLTKGMSDTNSAKKIYITYENEFGLNKPLWQQFIIYIKNLLHGDLGISMGQYPRTVTSILANALPWTIALQLPAILISWLLGNILGAIAAYIKGTFDKVILPSFLFLSCIPSFGFAIIFVWIFAIALKIAPASGGYGFDMIPNLSLSFILSVIQHYQLPFWSIVICGIGEQAIGMREMSIYELNADYVKYSRLLGIKDKKIVKYVFKNAMLPQITGLAISIGSMVGGALITEIVFSYPGIGTSMFNAIASNDYTLISGCTLIITLGVLLANFILEIIYGLVDPRIKATQEE